MSSYSADIRISRRFTRLYILALSAVAFLSISGQLLIQHEISNQKSDSRVINLAGRQRFQSQQIVKTILILTERKNEPAQRQVYLQDLKKVLTTWESYHRQLQSGYLKELGTSVKNSEKIGQLFGELEPHFLIIQYHTHQILNWLEDALTDDTQRMEVSVREVLNHELVFLRKMDEIVFQYDKEAKQKLDTLWRSELILLGLTLFVLALEGTLVFRPAVRELKRVIIQLIDSELRTQQANTELMQVNQSLKKAEADLLSLTRQQHQQEINEQKLRAAYVIEGQEEERRRLAREIHDGLGHMFW